MYQTFVDWVPDAEGLGTVFAADVENVLPGPNCYFPWPSLVTLTAALPGPCLNAWATITSDGVIVLFAGTATDLYKLNSTTLDWDVVTRAAGGAYAATAASPWHFTLFENQSKSYVVATTINDNPQIYEVGVSATFADLAGSPFKAALCGVWGNQLILGRLLDYPNAVQGSDIDDPTVWAPSPSNSAFFQEFADGGAVTGFNNSDQPLILQERVIRRGQIVGLPFKIIFEQVAADHGTRAQESVAFHDDRLFFLAEDGFYAASAAQGIDPIGSDAINRWFFANVETNDIELTQGIVDPIHPRVYWSFRSVAGALGQRDTTLCYDWVKRRWTKGTFPHSCAATAATPGMSLESLEALYGSLEDIPNSLDSREYAGTAPSIGVITTDNKLALFSGPAMAARLTTAEFPNAPHTRTRLQRAIPIIDATSAATVTVRRRNTRDVAFAAASPVSVNSSGHWPLNHSSRFFQLQMDVPAAESWTKAQGVHIDAVPEGVR